MLITNFLQYVKFSSEDDYEQEEDQSTQMEKTKVWKQEYQLQLSFSGSGSVHQREKEQITQSSLPQLNTIKRHQDWDVNQSALCCGYIELNGFLGMISGAVSSNDALANMLLW